MNWFIHSFKNIFNFEGRARRAEFGWFILIGFLIQLGISLVFLILLMGGSLFSDLSFERFMNQYALMDFSLLDIISNIVSFIFFLVGISLTTRRLHDLGWSGWWQLLFYCGSIPFVLLIMPFAFTQSDSGLLTVIAGAYLVYLIAMCLALLILIFKDGQPYANKYGESPKYPSHTAVASPKQPSSKIVM